MTSDLSAGEIWALIGRRGSRQFRERLPALSRGLQGQQVYRWDGQCGVSRLHRVLHSHTLHLSFPAVGSLAQSGREHHGQTHGNLSRSRPAASVHQSVGGGVDGGPERRPADAAGTAGQRGAAEGHLEGLDSGLVLLAQVCMNFYLERKIYQYVMSLDQPEHRNLELLSVYVSLLRRAMVCAGVCVLAAVCFRYRDPLQQSLQVLQQLRETQHSLQEALQHADSLRRQQTMELKHLHKRLSRTEDQLKKPPSTAEESLCGVTSDPSPDRKPHNSSSSPLVYSILVEDKQPRRYSLRSRRSEKF
ncbi:uncharacterized protein ACB058_018935 [Synchiropus picturatus]